METFEQDLLQTVRERKPGESFLDAFGRFVSEPRGLVAARDPDATEFLAALTRMITDSPALLARERQVFDRYTTSLAALIAEQTGAGADDVKPWVAAHALMGVHQALVDYTRRRILAGVRTPRLAREVRTQAKSALEALESGLGDYGAR
jgi:AcrR family transcriptional regulator